MVHFGWSGTQGGGPSPGITAPRPTKWLSQKVLAWDIWQVHSHFRRAGLSRRCIDLTPTHDQTGPARLLDLVAGRLATALADWLAAQPADFSRASKSIPMDGFASYKTTATQCHPYAVTLMDPFHVVALAGAKLDLIRQRIHQQTLGRRGHTGDPLYGIRRIARTRLQLLSTRQYSPPDRRIRRRGAPRRPARLADLSEVSSPPTPIRTGAAVRRR